MLANLLNNPQAERNLKMNYIFLGSLTRSRECRKLDLVSVELVMLLWVRMSLLVVAGGGMWLCGWESLKNGSIKVQ